MKLTVLLGLVFAVGVYSKSFSYRNDALTELEKSLDEYLSTGIQPENLENVLSKNKLPQLFRKIESGKLDTLDDSTCSVCRLVTGFLVAAKRHGTHIDVLALIARLFCSALEIESPRVCTGVIERNADIFGYMIDNNEAINGERICSVIVPTCASEGEFEWTIDIPTGNSVEKRQPEGTNTFNILHLSDFHFDPNYVVGKSNDCGDPLCCQYDNEDGDANSGTACGYWTDYSADSPEQLVDEVFRQVQSHGFNYAYYTGDIISHRVWETSKENTTKDLRIIFEKFRSTLNVPVFPVLGNHEPHPINVWFSRSEENLEFSTRWLFDLISEEWSDWLDDEAKETILEGGFYTISPAKGFRIIALNSNVAYISNWWLIDDDVDPFGQLAWLAKTLKKAEDNDEKVHILQHVPSGTGTSFSIWSREYNKLVNRFANTITGQFTGHTHKDEFYVYYNTSEPSQAINVAWNGASVVPFVNSNPSYKLYTVDSDTFDLLDQEEWTFDLTAANENPNNNPEWYQLYTFKDAYGLDSMDAASVGELTVQMARDHSLIDQYHRFKFRDSPMRGDCDEWCQKDCLCSMSTTNVVDHTHCQQLQQIYDENKN